MAFRHSPLVIRNGLVMYADAANMKSYPGSGTEWYNMMGTANCLSGSLQGPTLSGTSSMYFDGGANTVVYFHPTPVATDVGAKDNFTVTVICKPTSTLAVTTEISTGINGTSNQRYVIGPAYSGSLAHMGAGVSVGTNGISVFEHGPAQLYSNLVWSNPVSDTSFTNVAVRYTNRIPSLFVNGVFAKTGIISTAGSAVYLYLQSWGNESTNYGAFTGYLRSVLVYNRSLTDDEIVRNDFTLRGNL